MMKMIQPLDLGIIRAFKARYKKKLLQSILSNMKEKSTPSEIQKCINVLDAVHWVAGNRTLCGNQSSHSETSAF